MTTEQPARLRRELETVRAMMRIYCKAHHRRSLADCSPCGELLEYAAQRLDWCPYGAEKPTCANCPIHCYRPERRERIREVMRYAGPRMLLRHPWLAMRHKLDGRVRAPQRPGRQRRGPPRPPSS